MSSWPKNSYEACKENKYETFIKCGCPNSVTIPIGTENTTNIVLTTLNLDVSCLCDPKIKLDFTTNHSSTAEVSVRIQVFRQCKNQLNPVAIGPSWNLLVGVAGKSSTFTFFLCDLDTCVDRDCCTYTVVATPVTIPPEVRTINALIFNNSTLVATVTSE